MKTLGEITIDDNNPEDLSNFINAFKRTKECKRSLIQTLDSFRTLSQKLGLQGYSVQYIKNELGYGGMINHINKIRDELPLNCLNNTEFTFDLYIGSSLDEIKAFAVRYGYQGSSSEVRNIRKANGLPFTGTVFLDKVFEFLREYKGIRSMRNESAQKIVNEILGNPYESKLHVSQFDNLTTLSKWGDQIDVWGIKSKDGTTIKSLKALKGSYPNGQTILRVFSKFCVDQGYTQEEKKQYRLQVFGIKNDQSRLRNPLMKKKPRKSQFDVLQSIEDRKVFAQEKGLISKDGTSIRDLNSIKGVRPSGKEVLLKFRKYCTKEGYSEKETRGYYSEVFGMRTGVRRKRSPEKIKENKIQRAKKIMITGVEYYNACNYKLALIEFVKIESLEGVAIYISKCKEMIVELKKQEEILKLKEVEQKGIDKVKVEGIKLCRSGRYSSALVQFEKIANIDGIQQYINLCHEKINIAQEKQEEKKRTLGIREKGMGYYKKGAYIKALNEFRKIEGVTSVAGYIRNCNIHMMKAKRIEKEEKIREEKKKRALWIVQKGIDLFNDGKYENALREFERIESEAGVKKRVDACNKKINAIKETERRRVLEIGKKKSLINKRDLTDPVFLLTPSESTGNDRAPRDGTATKVTGKSRLLGKLLTEVLQARVRGNKVVKLQLDLEEALSTNYAVNIKGGGFERKVTLKVSESVREILEESEYIEKLKKFKLNLVRIGKK